MKYLRDGTLYLCSKVRNITRKPSMTEYGRKSSTIKVAILCKVCNSLRPVRVGWTFDKLARCSSGWTVCLPPLGRNVSLGSCVCHVSKIFEFSSTQHAGCGSGPGPFPFNFTEAKTLPHTWFYSRGCAQLRRLMLFVCVHAIDCPVLPLTLLSSASCISSTLCCQLTFRK